MTCISSKKSGTRILRYLSVCLALCFFSGMLTACSGRNSRKKKIDAPEMARILVDSLPETSDREELFSRIPEDQRDGMTYSEYYEYISVLTEMMPRVSRAVSFEIIVGSEKTQLLEEMIFESSSPAYAELIRSCIPVKVEIIGSRVSEVPIIFYLQTKPDGTVYLDRDWAKSCMELYSFANHYFEAFSNENLTDVISLLSHTQVVEPLPDSRDILKEKAKEKIRFYSHNVKSTYREYEMISIDASRLVYLQPEVLDSQLQTNARKVTFLSDEDGKISVIDPLENELKTADLYLYYNGRRTVRVGEHAAPSQLSSMFGSPITITCGPVVEKSPNSADPEDGLRNILLRYRGFTITVYGVFHSADDWDGTYTRFRIWNSRMAGIGMEMSVNESSFDILKRYPFADETGYLLSITMDGEEYEFSATLDRDNPNEDGSYPIDTMILERVRE